MKYMDDHKLELQEIFRRYESDPEIGLTDEKATEVLARDGPNVLPPVMTTPGWMKFLKEMFDSFALLLWSGVIFCFVAHHDETLLLGIVLTTLILVRGCLSYYQKAKSSKIMNSLKAMISQETTVIRNAQRQTIKCKDLVVGDIVYIQSGDCIPADIRIIECHGFQIDGGEFNFHMQNKHRRKQILDVLLACIASEPLPRSNEMTSENILETKNLAFLSTFAAEGTAKGIVIRTGDRCLISQLVSLVSYISTCETPIEREIAHSIRIITAVAVLLGILFSITATILGYPLVKVVIFLIGIIVAIVPKSLLSTFTVCLTVTAKRMAKKNCVVKHFETIETLGSTSIICSNKTGLLTQNRMTVAHMWFDNRVFDATNEKNSLDWTALSHCAILCNNADFKRDPENLSLPILQRECYGDAVESALFKYVELSIGNVIKFRAANRKVCEIRFNSNKKFQISIHEIRRDDQHLHYLLVMKGAYEIILNKCSTILIDGQDVEINDDWRNASHSSCMELGNLGECVLGFCDLVLPTDQYPEGYQFNAEQVNFPIDNLRFLGVISMIAPPRATVPEAIAKCHSAGIKVIMITGDHPSTAEAIAHAVGIIGKEDINAQSCVIHGNDLHEMTFSQLDNLLKRHSEIIFARISPYQKLNIVEACQRQGAIVAVTGDGVNDCAALRKADIGIAMGINGSDISKQVADMILLNDNFASIVMGIEEGRLVIDNLKKSIAYTLTSSISEIAPVLIYFISDTPLALGTMAILIIAIIPSGSFAYEKAERDIMKRRPRDPKHNRLFNMVYGQIGLIEASAGFLTYLVIMAENGFLPSRLLGLRQSWDSKYINDLEDSYGQEWTYEQRKQLEFTCHTAYFVTIVICQWAVLISNCILNFSLIFGIVLTVIISYLTPVLNTYPLKFLWWLLPTPYLFLILICERQNPRRETFH